MCREIGSGGICHQMDSTCLPGLEVWTGISFDEEVDLKSLIF